MKSKNYIFIKKLCIDGHFISLKIWEREKNGWFDEIKPKQLGKKKPKEE